MKYCSRCGAELADEAVFCTKCGGAIGTTGQIAPVVSEIGRKFVVGLLVLVLGIVGVIYSVYIFNHTLPKEEAAVAIICIFKGSAACREASETLDREKAVATVILVVSIIVGLVGASMMILKKPKKQLG